MARQRSAGAREHHAPRHISDLAPQFLVDEVTDAPGRQAERYKRRQEVGHLKKTAVRLARVPPHRDRHAQHAAVKRHAARPDGKNLERMPQVVQQVVEQHVTDTAAEYGAERDVENKVTHFLRVPSRQRVFARAVLTEPPAADEADDVHQPVPVNRGLEVITEERERRKRNRGGINIGGDHGATLWTSPAAENSWSFSG